MRQGEEWADEKKTLNGHNKDTGLPSGPLVKIHLLMQGMVLMLMLIRALSSRANAPWSRRFHMPLGQLSLRTTATVCSPVPRACAPQQKAHHNEKSVHNN